VEGTDVKMFCCVYRAPCTQGTQDCRQQQSADSKGRPKKINGESREIGEDDDKKCHLVCFLNSHGLLRNLLAVVWIYVYVLCVHISELVGVGWEGWNVELVSLGAHDSLNLR
jgi:hypothetical protein